MSDPVPQPPAITPSPRRCPGMRGRPRTTCIVGSPLSAAGGVAVTGIDLSQPITPTLREMILNAFLDYHVVVFPNQVLSREQQYRFIASLGKVEPHGGRNARAKRYAVAHVISNLDGNGRPVDRSSSPVSNYRWHTDKAYNAVPPMLTALYAVELPPQGGDTEFANTQMGYAALSEVTKQRIAGLRVVFRWAGSRHAPGIPPLSQTGPEARPPVDHPLVRTHPVTGKKALYLGNHASHILGMPPDEGTALLEELLEHTTKPQFVYAHHWRVGDLLIWDNRCLLHRAVANYEVSRYRRILHRNVVRGTVPF
ncbi:MAG: TauD/TfdA family dioxygenase [Alphaproteobacteria bacterium]|nr:TauD/TfdA family dioxygenase [Alphaproteobacteria bacterium]